MRRYRTLAARVVLVVAAGLAGCKANVEEGPPLPASSDPEGKDLVVGAIVAAWEKGAAVKQESIRLYKIVDVVYFPPPMSDELVMLAYTETSTDFRSAAATHASGKLTIKAAQVRVQRHLFRTRDYRVLANVPVTDADRTAKPADARPEKP
ncbi:MAG: hypothetical protein FJ096_19380 [Deltaproteobacteria bacterium]|nr:hypothetical protein [Deltaproteobacteria bacterium]